MPPSIDSLDLPPLLPRFPWWGAELQTIAVLLTGARATDLAPHTSERMAFPMADRTGDILLGMLDRPAGRAEDLWIPVEEYRESNRADNPSLVPLMPPTGGHVGLHAHDSTRPWCDLAVEKFIDRLAIMET